MELGITALVGLGLAVAAVVMMTPRNRDEWYHKAAGYGKPYHGQKEPMGGTYTLMFTSAFLFIAFGAFGVVYRNTVMIALAAGCFAIALVTMGLSAGHDRNDAAQDGISVEYNRNGGIAGFLAVIAMIGVAAVTIVAAGAMWWMGR